MRKLKLSTKVTSIILLLFLSVGCDSEQNSQVIEEEDSSQQYLAGTWMADCIDDGELNYAKSVVDISNEGLMNITKRLYEDISCTNLTFEIGYEVTIPIAYTLPSEDGSETKYEEYFFVVSEGENTNFYTPIHYEIQGDLLYFSHMLTITTFSYEMRSDKSDDINYTNYLVRE